MVSLASTGERSELAQSLTCKCVWNVPSALLFKTQHRWHLHLCFAANSIGSLNFHAYCSIVYMVGTDEESFEWLDVNKVPEEVRILQDTVNVLDLPRPPEVQIVQCLPLERAQACAVQDDVDCISLEASIRLQEAAGRACLGTASRLL